MKAICDEICKFVRSQFHDIIDVQQFNHVTILIYSGENEVCKLNFHRDQVYNRHGEFLAAKNSQKEGTPTCVLTFGDTRILQFKLFHYQEQTNGNYRMKPYDGIDNIDIQLNHGSLFVLHPKDEIPLLRSVCPGKSFFKHGNVKFGGNGKMSIAFICRSCTHTAKVNNFTGQHFISSHDVLDDIIKHNDSIQMLRKYNMDSSQKRSDLKCMPELYQQIKIKSKYTS